MRERRQEIIAVVQPPIHHNHGARLADNRLIGAVIFDGHPQVLAGERYGSVDAVSLAVGTAMSHPAGHRADEAAIDRPPIEMPHTADSAHFSAVYCAA